MNKCFLIGRLTRDVALSHTQSGHAVAKFTLAVDRAKKDAGSDFISCEAWNKTAELLAEYVHRGDEIALTGHIHTGSYEKDGRTIYTTDAVAEQIKFLRKRHNASEMDAEEAKAQDDFAEADDSDLPF